MYQIITPKTQADFTKYYYFRWQQLKQASGFAMGSEKDEYDSLAEHRMICNDKGEPLAVGRIHFVSHDEAQIRHIAVADNCRGKGLGSLIMTTLENAARQQNILRIITFSKVDAINFFEHCGYKALNNPIIELADSRGIQRKQMCKKLSEYDVILRHPELCKELQQTWNKQIPIAQLMGIKIHQYTGVEFEVRAALNANINLHGTMFAGSIYSMATLAGWGMVHLQLKEANTYGEIVLAKGEIKYFKPITSVPRALVSINSVDGDFSGLAKGKPARLGVKVELFSDTELVGEFEGKYAILPMVEKSEKKLFENKSEPLEA